MRPAGAAHGSACAHQSRPYLSVSGSTSRDGQTDEVRGVGHVEDAQRLGVDEADPPVGSDHDEPIGQQLCHRRDRRVGAGSLAGTSAHRRRWSCSEG